MNQLSMFDKRPNEPSLPPPDDPGALARLIKSCKVIYRPKGLALEYADLATNLYRGCGHGCRYCYAPSTMYMKSDEFHNAPKPRNGYFMKLVSDCWKFKQNDMATLAGPVLLCFTCDAYQPLDVEVGLTRQTIEELKKAGLKVQILTKGGSRALRDLDLLTPEDAFATTLTLADNFRSKLWEPNAAPPEDRINTIKAFHRAGIPTWVSLEPVLYPDVALDLIRMTHPFVDVFKVGKLNYAGRLPPELRREVEGIDWHTFGHKVEALLKSLGQEYYIKKDLRAAMARS